MEIASRFLYILVALVLFLTRNVSAEKVPLIRASKDRIAQIDWQAAYQMGCAECFDISVTSYHPPIGEKTYEVANLVDVFKDTAWIEGVDGLGKNEQIIFELNTLKTEDLKRFNGDFLVINGLAKDEQTWQKNARVKQLACFYNGDHVFTVELQDMMQPQSFSLRDVKALEEVSFKVGDRISFMLWTMYEGLEFEDTCLSAFLPIAK